MSCCLGRYPAHRSKLRGRLALCPPLRPLSSRYYRLTVRCRRLAIGHENLAYGERVPFFNRLSPFICRFQSIRRLKEAGAQQCSVKDSTNCGISSAHSSKRRRCTVTTLNLYKPHRADSDGTSIRTTSTHVGYGRITNFGMETAGQ
jgi:hypothetical protein